VVETRPLPVPAMDRAELIRAVEATLAEQIRVPSLEHALAQPSSTGDARTDLRTIVSELFDLFGRTRRAADAMERCAREAPDLAELFYRGVRGRLLAQLAAYCARRSEPGAITPDVAARFVVETTTWWARHRHHDPEPLAIEDDAAREIAVTLIVRALVDAPD